jgi:hypothetical protein
MNQYEIEKIKRENEELKRRLKKAQEEAEEAALMGAVWGTGRRRALNMWGVGEITSAFD